jgi:hypothetical protein
MSIDLQIQMLLYELVVNGGISCLSYSCSHSSIMLGLQAIMPILAIVIRKNIILFIPLLLSVFQFVNLVLQVDDIAGQFLHFL